MEKELSQQGPVSSEFKVINDGVTEEQADMADQQIYFTAVVCFNTNAAWNYVMTNKPQPTWEQTPKEIQEAYIKAVHAVCLGHKLDLVKPSKENRGVSYFVMREGSKKKLTPLVETARCQAFEAIVLTMMGD